MMPLSLRLALLVVSLIIAIFVFRKIRKSQFVIEDSLYWIFFCVFLIILSIFPQISSFFAGLIGIESPANFVFLVFIFLLLIKIFFLSLKVSKLQTKLEQLVSKYAIDNAHTDKDNIGEK